MNRQYNWTQIPVTDNDGTIKWIEYGLRTATAVYLVAKDRQGRGWVLMGHEHEPAIPGLGYRWSGPAAIRITPARSGELFFHSAEAARNAAEDLLNNPKPKILVAGKDDAWPTNLPKLPKSRQKPN